MTQRTSEMHPWLECPYHSDIQGTSFVDANLARQYRFTISIVDERTGEQVEGRTVHSLTDLRNTLGRRMAWWRKEARREALAEEAAYA